MDESLLGKLKSLGVQVGTGDLSASKKQPNDFPIDEVIEGKYRQTAFGNVFEFTQVFPTDYFHGIVALNRTVDHSSLIEWARLSALPTLPGRDQLIFLDTETSGLAGGTGTYAFLIGIGFYTPAGFQVTQLFMRTPDEEEALLAALAEILAGYTVLVTFNGKSFDVPLLNTRHTLNRIPSPLPQFGHVDLLPLARRLWRNRLESRALKDLETEILGVSRSSEEVPGWMIPELYFEYLHTKDARPLAGIFYHNALDIVSLSALYVFCADLLAHPMEIEIPGLDLMAIARLYEDLDRIDGAMQVYERCLQAGDLPLPFYLSMLERYALLYRRRGEWETAARLWETGAKHAHIESIIELSKYNEHQLRDFSAACRWAEQALAALNQLTMPRWQRQEKAAMIEHRIDRLKKLTNRSGK